MDNRLIFLVISLLCVGNTACFMSSPGSEYDYEVLVGYIELTSDQLRVRVDPQGDDCELDHTLQGSVAKCADWLALSTWLPFLDSQTEGVEVGEAHPVLFIPTFIVDSMDDHGEFWGDVHPEEMAQDCGLSTSDPEATLTRLNETEWIAIDYRQPRVAYELKFDHPCLSGELRYFRNVRVD